MQEIIYIWGIIKEISPVLVGCVALLVYILQVRKKVSEAASLIVMQVEELKKKIQEIGSYIVDGKLDDGAFYESQPLFEKNYWNEYKHYFVRKIDSGSFNIFNDFYNCASEILEQQQLMKNLQKNFFFIKQNSIVNVEIYFIQKTMEVCCNTNMDINKITIAAGNTLPPAMPDDQKKILEDMIKNIVSSNPNFDSDMFWRYFNKNKIKFHEIVNNNALTSYIPLQIKISLENILKQESSIEIIGCSGYNKMKRIAAGKFFM